MRFMESWLIVAEGSLIGQPFKLDLFQQVFLYAVYDNPRTTRRAFLSMARKNGKTALIAGIVAAHIIGPEARRNTQIRSGAQSREQAALVFEHAKKMLQMTPALDGLYKPVSSHKSILGINLNVDFRSISAEASTAHGLSPVLAILDEIGQIIGPVDPFVDAITTSQGAHDDPLLIAISTSAASDADLFSVWCDDAERSDDPHNVCHVYSAEPECDLLDEKQWRYANPALGNFRNRLDLENQLKQASRLPTLEAGARNLLLNQRVSLVNKWLAPSVWKANKAKPDWQVFQEYGAYIGLDLSQRKDLTCAVLAQKDEDGFTHLWCFAFTPLDGIKERSKQDRIPYDQWVRDGLMYGVPGKTVDYDWVAQFLKKEVADKGVEILSIEFDRWRIAEFKKACERAEFITWTVFNEVGQGYKDQSPRIDAFETALLQDKIKHGNHPLLTLGASSAIAIKDPAGNKKLDKSKSSNKIDTIVASVMAAYPLLQADDFDPDSLVG